MRCFRVVCVVIVVCWFHVFVVILLVCFRIWCCRVCAFSACSCMFVLLLLGDACLIVCACCCYGLRVFVWLFGSLCFVYGCSSRLTFIVGVL